MALIHCGSSGAGCSCQCFVREHCVFCVSLPERMSDKGWSGALCTCFFYRKGRKDFAKVAITGILTHSKDNRIATAEQSEGYLALTKCVCFYCTRCERSRTGASAPAVNGGFESLSHRSRASATGREPQPPVESLSHRSRASATAGF